MSNPRTESRVSVQQGIPGPSGDFPRVKCPMRPQTRLLTAALGNQRRPQSGARHFINISYALPRTLSKALKRFMGRPFRSFFRIQIFHSYRV
ncbi:hypothetical protein NPIL_625981 [Nephila pilipes]|uniref:Uncharacterized protein n=1 Tax=Nephila pilipes TaxID=299642 RepID=A0A8X6PSE4_NEPPI|nr:hypothetical protein NPIL_625981 [Nephila pilipes]